MSDCANSSECCPNDPFAYSIEEEAVVVTYWNTEQTATCAEGYTGDPVTIAANTYSSTESQAAADALALAAAEGALSCAAGDCLTIVPVMTDYTTDGVTVGFVTETDVPGSELWRAFDGVGSYETTTDMNAYIQFPSNKTIVAMRITPGTRLDGVTATVALHATTPEQGFNCLEVLYLAFDVPFTAGVPVLFEFPNAFEYLLFHIVVYPSGAGGVEIDYLELFECTTPA